MQSFAGFSGFSQGRYILSRRLTLLYLVCVMVLLILFQTSQLNDKRDVRTMSSSEIKESSNNSNLCNLSQHNCDPNRTNIVWYNYGDRAGLDDRRQVLFTLSNLAESLCARLAVPPPLRLLDPDRHFTELSPGLSWDKLVHVSSRRDGYSVLWELRRPEVELASTRYHAYQRITTRQPTSFLSDYMKLRTAALETSTETRAFVWEVKVSWHQVKQHHWSAINTSQKMVQQGNLSLSEVDGVASVPAVFSDALLQPSVGCLYIQPFGIPSEMALILEKVWRDILLLTGSDDCVGFLHLRRGDAVDRCDTSLAKLKDYLACSLPAPAFASNKITLLFASDEVDSEYRDGVASVVESLRGKAKNVQLVDLDGIVWKHVHNLGPIFQSNYYIYTIEWHVKNSHQVRFVLERRHSQHCQDCEDIRRFR